MSERVAVIGLGGVGSWAAEALARSGIGRLTLIDADDLCVSNTNRQLHALDGEYGRSKVEVLAERFRRINPALDVRAVADFVTPANLAEQLDGGFDLVLDAFDSFRAKVETIAFLGSIVRLQVRVGDAVFVLDEFNNPHLTLPEIGATVTASFPGEACLILDREGRARTAG